MSTPLPIGKIVIDSDGVEFWRHVRERDLSFQRCADCGTLAYPPRAYCSHCLGERLDWTPVSGRGQVHTHVTFEHAFRPDLKDHVPYSVALVELEEGVRMWSNVVGTAPEDVHIGMPVQLVYEEREGETVPRFQAR